MPTPNGERAESASEGASRIETFAGGLYEATVGNVLHTAARLARATAKSVGAVTGAAGEVLMRSGDLGKEDRGEILKASGKTLKEGLGSAGMEVLNGAVQAPIRLVRGAVRAVLSPIVQIQPIGSWDIGNTKLSNATA